jgi:hypothetical protein
MSTLHAKKRRFLMSKQVSCTVTALTASYFHANILIVNIYYFMTYEFLGTVKLVL